MLRPVRAGFNVWPGRSGVQEEASLPPVDPFGLAFLEPGSSRDAKAALSALREASDMGLTASPAGGGRWKGAVVVFATTSVAANPTDRAKSINPGAASRNLACHTGESTIKTSFPPVTFPSLQWGARAGGRQGRSSCSIASSHKAWRTGSVAASDIAACRAGCGDEARRGWDFESDIGIHDFPDHRKQFTHPVGARANQSLWPGTWIHPFTPARQRRHPPLHRPAPGRGRP